MSLIKLPTSLLFCYALSAPVIANPLGWDDLASRGMQIHPSITATKPAKALIAAKAAEAQNDKKVDSPRQRISFDDDWRFNLGDCSGSDDALDDRGWQPINLPHDWAIHGPFEPEFEGSTGHLKFWGPVWYRKHFTCADQGKKVFLDIDGAMSHAKVWLNSQLVGGRPYGYSSFRLDLTPFMYQDKENVLAIRLDSPPASSRWYPGAGIYRNVWLTITSPVHVDHWGTFVTTPVVTKETASVKIKVDVKNDTASDTNVDIHNLVVKPETASANICIVGQSTQSNVKLRAGKTTSFDSQIELNQPSLWSISNPRRYSVITTVEQNGKAVDAYETSFGVRTIKFDADKGFFLNGEHVRLNGVCNHHDLGALGAALNVRALERQLELLKQMGGNAIRTSHNPPAPELLDLCDRMGFLVMDESFDCWEREKRPGDYHLLYRDWHEKDLRSQIRRDRNHPCVILWSIGNEIAEQENEHGRAVGKELADIVHQEDSTRPVTAACHRTDAGYNGFQNVVDVFGYNYKPNEYGKFHASNPKLPVFGSETSSCVSSRGEYFFPVIADQSGGKADFQVSSYDLYAPPWATTPDAEFRGQDANPFAAGEFVWTGFDYIGEPTPYDSDSSNLLNFTNPEERLRAEKELSALGKIRVPSRSSYFGIMDLAGFKKDRYYSYQAKWRPDLPMAHIFPHWNWPERIGLVTPVHVYTSGDEAELFLNGKSLGRKRKAQYEYRLQWNDVLYEPGELKVVAYKNGSQWATDIVKTTGPPAELSMQADRDSILGDQRDLSFITLSINDKDGQMVPRSKNPVHFSIDGPGEIIATDNGDATDWTPFNSPNRNAFNGLCLVIVRATAAGSIAISASVDGLPPATTRITAR